MKQSFILPLKGCVYPKLVGRMEPEQKLQGTRRDGELIAPRKEVSEVAAGSIAWQTNSRHVGARTVDAPLADPGEPVWIKRELLEEPPRRKRKGEDQSHDW